MPHALAVAVEELAADRGGIFVEAAILVDHESQKGIVVGKGGHMIRAIGTAARQALAELWGVPVHLDLTVKVRRGWRQDDSMLNRLGLLAPGRPRVAGGARRVPDILPAQCVLSVGNAYCGPLKDARSHRACTRDDA